jgi:hypothetical protein
MQKSTNVIPNSPERRRTPRDSSKLGDILGVREQEECVGHEEEKIGSSLKGSFKRSFIKSKP